MFDFFKKLFGSKPQVSYKDLVAEGAQIVDVRTPAEYKGGHINKSVNIPLQDLQKQLKKLDKNKVVITCCASGMRSASAKSILISNGFNTVYNGGAWSSLRNKIA